MIPSKLQREQIVLSAASAHNVSSMQPDWPNMKYGTGIQVDLYVIFVRSLSWRKTRGVITGRRCTKCSFATTVSKSFRWNPNTWSTWRTCITNLSVSFSSVRIVDASFVNSSSSGIIICPSVARKNSSIVMNATQNLWPKPHWTHTN